MKIKTQKILKFIPIANFIILFIWIGAYYKHVTKPSRFIKNLLKMFLAVILITIPRIAAYKSERRNLYCSFSCTSVHIFQCSSWR